MNAKKTASPTASERRLRRAPRGQAMIEYSVISHFILVGGMVTLGLLGRTSGLFDALTKFYESIFFVLTSGAI